MQQRHLFEKVAQDWGYSNPNGSLESIVEQVISAPKDNMVLRVYIVWNLMELTYLRCYLFL